jgi:hypothetical protein
VLTWHGLHDSLLQVFPPPSHVGAVWQFPRELWQRLCSNFWIAQSTFSIEKQIAPVLHSATVGEHGLGVHRVGAHVAAHDVTQLADKSARSSSDSRAATGCQPHRERRGFLERVLNIDWVKRRTIERPSSAKLGTLERRRQTFHDRRLTTDREESRRRFRRYSDYRSETIGINRTNSPWSKATSLKEPPPTEPTGGPAHLAAMRNGRPHPPISLN